jgi:hypothetical protein
VSLAACLPFNPGDRVMRGCDGPFATVIECCTRAECPQGIYMVVRYDATGEEVGVVASEFSPIPERRELIRPIPQLAGVSHPEPASTLPALSGASPCGQGAVSGAPLSELDYQRVVDTLRRHTLGCDHD